MGMRRARWLGSGTSGDGRATGVTVRGEQRQGGTNGGEALPQKGRRSAATGVLLREHGRGDKTSNVSLVKNLEKIDT